VASRLMNITTQTVQTKQDMELADLRWKELQHRYLPRLQEAGLLKWSKVLVWNKNDRTTYKRVFEYRDADSFASYKPIWEDIEKAVFVGLTIKMAADRGILIEEMVF